MRYYIDKENLNLVAKPYQNIAGFAQALKLPYKFAYHILSGKTSSLALPMIEHIERITGKSRLLFMKVEGGEMVQTSKPIPTKRTSTNNTPPFYEECNITITGLKRNIENRLALHHSGEYVNSIMDLVDDIVKESSYFGVECEKHNASFIVMDALKARRARDTLNK